MSQKGEIDKKIEWTAIKRRHTGGVTNALDDTKAHLSLSSVV